MQELSSFERINNILHRKPVDRIGLFEHFWGDTQEKWTSEGHIREAEDLTQHFGFDFRMSGAWAFKLDAKLDFEPEIVEETEETILKRDGNGALMRTHKLHASTPEHVDFLVKDRQGWEEHIKPLLKPERERIQEGYQKGIQLARQEQRFGCLTDMHVFELMKNVTGHENMLAGMALDPDWIKDMVMTYSQLIVDLMEITFAEYGLPDGVWFYEDLGFKQRPFMSPQMYREIVMPGHKLTFDYIHAKGLKIIFHSCGFIEPLLPAIVESGIDCLQALEIKSGIDLLRVKKNFGDQIVLMGGLDTRNLVANDLDAIKAELAEKIPVVKENSGYILHSDHSIPDQVEYETFRYFVDEGLRLGKY